MLLPLPGRRIAYDLVGPEDAPTVCITHSLASDGGSWAEQVPAAAAGRLPRAAARHARPWRQRPGCRRLHDDGAGRRRRAGARALAIPRVHYIGLSIGGMIGQAFALAHGDRLISAMWCDTLPASPQGAPRLWDQRMNTVRSANSLEPLADPTVERWLTDDFKAKHPGRWKQIRDTVVGTTPAGYLGCCAAILDFDFAPRLPEVRVPVLVVCGAEDAGTRQPRTASSPASCRAPATRRWPAAGISRMSSARRVQPHHDGLARRAQTRTISNQTRTGWNKVVPPCEAILDERAGCTRLMPALVKG